MKEFTLQDGTILSQNEYLYGVDSKLEPIPAHIVCRRVELLEEVIEELQDQPYLVRDSVRLNACLKAKKFWQELGE